MKNNSLSTGEGNLTFVLNSEIAHTPLSGLSQSLGGGLYDSILELGCGDIETYRTLVSSLKQPYGIYLGFSMDKDTLKKMKTYYESHKALASHRKSCFFERDILLLSDQNNYFNLICVNSLQHHYMVRTEAALRTFILKLLKQAKKVVLHIIPSEELSGSQPTPSSDKDFTGEQGRVSPLQFFPIALYTQIAHERRKMTSVYEGEPFGYEHTSFKTKYLVFE